MCVRVGLPRSPGASVVCRRRHLKNKKEARFLSFHQRKYATFLEMLRKFVEMFHKPLSSCEKLTEAGSRMPIATTFRCGKAKSNSASFWSSRSEYVQRKLNFTHGLEDLSSCMRTKCSGRTAMSWASRCTVRRNGRHGQHSFCWRTPSIASVPCVITKKEGVVSLYRKTRKKSVCSWFVAESTLLGGELSPCLALIQTSGQAEKFRNPS